MRQLFTVVTALMACYLAWVIGVAIRHESIFVAGPRIAQDPWTWVTIVDLYLGFVLAGAVIIARERQVARWLPWVVGILVLGNLATAVYAVRWVLGGSANARHLPQTG
jgi:hypothetical protein